MQHNFHSSIIRAYDIRGLYGKTLNDIDAFFVGKSFASFLHKKNLLSSFDKIVSEYRNLYNKKHNIVEATVTLTDRLPEKTRIHLRESLKKKYKAREVHILEKVDERLIGGLKIKVADEVIDMTIKNYLTELKHKILK